MRKLSAGLFSSIDGVVEDPFLWQFDSFDAESGAMMTEMISRVDTVILGRVGYEQWASYWPTAEIDNDFAEFINPVKKYVASRTLTGEPEWQNSELITGDLLEFVRQLKETEGNEISLMASISLVRQLLFAGLLDELTLMINPVIAGAGRHLFEADDPTTRLELVSSRITSAGNTILTYRLRPA